MTSAQAVPRGRVLVAAALVTVLAATAARLGAGTLESPLQQPRASAAATVASGSLSGIVVLDDADARPIRRATVTLSGSELPQTLVATTDDSGRFTFERLPAGHFTLKAARLGYVPTAYGATRGWRSAGVPIALENAQQLAGLPLRMIKGAVLSGRVTNQYGLPLVGCTVQIGELRMVNGEPVFTSAITGDAVRTDDRGIYRAYGLPPGTFIVDVENLGSEPSRTWESMPADLTPPLKAVPIYYPGTPDAASAATIALAAGEERSGIDLVYEPIPTSKIAGTVTGPTGEPALGVTLLALRIGGTVGIDRVTIPPMARADAAGAFTMRGLPPGRYAVLAQPAGPTGGAASGLQAAAARLLPGQLFGKAEVVITGGDLTGVDLRLLPGVIVSGRVALENRSEPAAELVQTKVRLTPAPSAVAAAVIPLPVDVKADGSFQIDGVGPGSYLVSVVPAGSSWLMKAAVVGSRDLVKNALDVQAGQAVSGVAITLIDRAAEISGRLLDAGGQPAPGYFVLAFPVDRLLWTLGAPRLHQPVRPSSDGQYRITGLLPGAYYIAALTEMQPTDYTDSTFMELLVPASTRITLAEGEKKTQDLRFATGR